MTEPGRDLLVGRSLPDCSHWARRLNQAGIVIPERSWITPQAITRCEGIRPRVIYITPTAGRAADFEKLIRTLMRSRAVMHRDNIGATVQLKAPHARAEAL